MSERLPLTNMTVEEYLRFEAESRVRHEYVDGQVFAMTGANDAHNVICVNLLTKIHTHLRGSTCRAYMNDMKVHVEAANRFYYPDIMVTCEPFVPKSVFKESPVLIVEVLSPSTKQIDKREKWLAYRMLDSLKEYLLVHQDRQRLELYSRQAYGEWSITILSPEDELCLKSIESPFVMPIKDIYEKADLPPVVKEEEEEYHVGLERLSHS